MQDNEASELVHVYVNGEEIVCTNEHPFYSPVKDWTAACKLRAGDALVTSNGEYVVVEWVQHEILESPITVYNFEVADSAPTLLEVLPHLYIILVMKQNVVSVERDGLEIKHGKNIKIFD